MMPRKMWAPRIALPLLLLAASASGGTLQYGRELLQVENWNFSSSPHHHPSPPPTRVRHYLGQYQSGSNIASIGSSSTEIKDLVALQHCIRNGVSSRSGFCRDYYQCQAVSEPGLFSVYLLSCPEGTVFEESLNACDFSYRATKRPGCMTGEAITSVTLDRVNLGLDISSLIDNSANSFPILKRQKRIAVATVLTGLIAFGSLVSAGSAVAGAVKANKKGSVGVNLRGIENKLIGIDGKIKNIELSVLESQLKNRMNFEVIQNLVSKGTEENQANFEITQNLISHGILENRISTAAIQGLITQGNTENELNFAKVQVSIGELKAFINQEIIKAKSDIEKGFESVSSSIDQSRIEPLVSKLLTLIKGFSQRLNHLQSLSEKAQKDEIERSGGYLEYLESSTLQDTLNDIIHQNFGIPSSVSDISAVFILDLLVHGVQVHASMLSSIVSSNVYLAVEALEDKRLDEFNTYMLRVGSSISRIKLAMGYSGRQGLIGEVKAVLNKVQHLPYASRIHGLNELLSEKRADLDQLESDIEALVADNTELGEPGTIGRKPDFSSSSISVPIGPWENGKQVSYAMQILSESGLSRVGEWSTPYTIQGKANPTISLPRVEDGIVRVIYRKFNQEKPECVGVVRDNVQTSFRDIERDLLNAAARPNEDVAVKETNSLTNNDGADVNIFIENKMTPLHYAARHGNVRVMEILMNKGANIHAKTSDNEVSLHFAALFGAEEGVDYLISKGAQVNAQTKLLGLSALHIAVANGRVNAARALIRNKAFINIKDNNGLVPLHISVTGNENTIDVLLESETLDVNAVAEDGLTPLHYAARSSSDVFVRKLLQHNDIETNPLSDSLLSPLHLAAMTGNVDVMSELIRHGAYASAADKYGSTPLHYAAFYGNRKATLMLLQMDPSMENIKNNEDKSALDLAVENNRETVVEILGNNIENLLEIIANELRDQSAEPSPQSASLATYDVETLSNCSNEVVEKMAKSSEDTCAHIGNIDSYVNLVMSMIPLQIYYENHEEFSQIFQNYDYDLGVAQGHAKIWRNGDSIIKGIRQTFELAKQFEPEFRRKYKVNQKLVEGIKANVDQVKLINQTKDDIQSLEVQLSEAEAVMNQAVGEAVKQFFRNHVDSIKSEIVEKQRILREDFTLIQELEELVDFLEFVRVDSSKIKVVAVKTREKIETFRDNLEQDKSAFERHGRIATETFETLQEETIKNNNALAEYKRKQEELERKVEIERQETKALYAKINESHEKLRDMRRKLLDKIKSSKTMKIIGAILTPLLIGIPLLVHANNEEKKYIQILKSTVENSKQEVDVLNAQIKNKYNDISMFQELIANSSTNSNKVKSEMHVFITLDGDLTTLASEVETLLEAIEKAIVGVRVIKGVFDDVTKKLTEMIDLAKEAKTEAERLNAKYFIYNELSLLECNWRDVYIKVMNLDECTQNFQILH